MNGTRLWPAVQVLGRTIACNRSDILQQGFRLYNHGTSASYSQNNNSSNTYCPRYDDKLYNNQTLIHTGKGSYMKIVSRNLATGIQLFCREFSDYENEHAHNVLCSLPAYKYTTFNDKLSSVNYVDTFGLLTYKDKFWPSVCTDELVHTFLNISRVLFVYNSEVDGRKFSILFNHLIERLPYMTDNQLIIVLTGISFWSPSYANCSKQYDMLWKALDKCCFERICKWDTSKILLFADYWYAMRKVKLSYFFSKVIFEIGANLNNLTPTQFVQFMFYANLNRDFPAKKKHIISKVEQCTNCVSIEELGIIAMGLFKTRTFINEMSVLKAMIKYTEENLDNISDHSLGAILKFLNKSFPANAEKQCYDFLEKISSHLHKFNNFVHLQVALFGNNLLVFHENSLRKVSERFVKEMPSLRLKDIERFTYTLMLYKYIPSSCPHILLLIVEELRKPERIVEINHFPRSFVSCVNYLVALEMFPHDLISAALQPSITEFLKDDMRNMGENSIGRELNELNWSVKIELPSFYLGYTLNPKDSKELTERFMGRIPSGKKKDCTHQERLLLDIQTKIAAMVGREEIVEPAIILPHFSLPDLIFCTTVDGEPVKLPEEFKNFGLADLKPALSFSNLGLCWNAVLIGGRNSLIRETRELKGNLMMKKRQLTKLGFKVSVVPYRGYAKTSTKYKLDFLEKCLQDSSLNLHGRKEMALKHLKNEDTNTVYNLEEGIERLIIG
ncbi:UNVERIFIED_CONTAM: hypothetical protein RMT77_002222 [Armadillidium vulgare]